MSTAVEIEQAIETLPPSEYAKLLAWFDERRASEVDARLEEAILAGKFDALAQQAERDFVAGNGSSGRLLAGPALGLPGNREPA